MHASTMIKALIAALAVSSPALAELAVTAPTASTTCTGGQVCTVSWDDDHTGVSLAQQGDCTVALYTGSAQQQTFLQPISFPTPVNVSTTASVTWTVDPTVGPDGSNYFIRFSSLNLTQTGSVQPYLSFSAKFTLTGMSGTFNQTVLNQIAAGTSSATTAAATTHALTTTAVTTHATTTSHTTTTSHSGAGLTAGVSGIFVAGAAIVAGVAGLF